MPRTLSAHQPFLSSQYCRRFPYSWRKNGVSPGSSCDARREKPRSSTQIQTGATLFQVQSQRKAERADG